MNSGEALGPYQLFQELGSGGMGTVYRAEGPEGVVAVKIVRPQLFETDDALERFHREVAIGRTVDHPNVVRTYGGGEADGRHYLAMELVEGQTLDALLKELERVPEELCRHIAHEVTQGLAAIHAAGAIHRDIKPENVLITPGHIVKIMDLGVARSMNDAMALSRTGMFVGSLCYSSPEQLKGGGKAIDGRVDLHALGLVLYELSTGVNPYVADEFGQVVRKVLHDEPRRLGDVNPQVSPFFEEVVHNLLAKDRDERFASAGDLLLALEEGEDSAWWHARAVALRIATKRPLRRVRIPRETAVFGRDAELAQLRALYEIARAGEGQVVLVEGEAGIGKSRIVDEFVAGLHRDDEEFQFLFGSYPPGAAGTAVGAFSTAYREHYGDEHLEDALAAHLSATPRLVPSFAAVLRGDSPPEGAQPLTPESLPAVFVHATRALSKERTTIVLIDDLHFAPEEGRALFLALALAAPTQRTLLIGTARRGLSENWVGGLLRHGYTSRMELGRLGAKDLARLLKDSLRSERLAGKLALLVAEKSDGNPFFVFEIIRGLREGQFLAQSVDGSWIATQDIERIDIPSSVLGLVQARVANLDEGERDLLDVAACCGFDFDPTLVGEVVGLARIPLLKRLGQIERKHRLVRAAGRRFVFDHHQVQEALYGSLSELLREEYHAALGDVVEARALRGGADPADVPGDVAARLCRHFFDGATPERAVRYVSAAYRHLEDGHLGDAAVALLDQALAEPGLFTGAPRLDLLLNRVERLDVLGRPAEELATIEEALALAEELGEPARIGHAQRMLGWHLARAGRMEEALALFAAAEEAARKSGDRALEARVLTNQGTALYGLGRLDEAREHQERSRSLADQLGDLRAESRAVVGLAVVSFAEGRMDDARKYDERYLEMARETGDLNIECLAHANLGSLAYTEGRLGDCRVHLERALSLARELGLRRKETRGVGDMGTLFAALGDYARAAEHMEECLALAREVGSTHQQGRSLRELGTLKSLLGDPATGREHLLAALDLHRATGARREVGSVLRSLADVTGRLGDQEGADAHFVDAIRICREEKDVVGAAKALIDRGLLLAALDRAQHARDALTEASAMALEYGDTEISLLAAARIAALPDSTEHEVAAARAALAVAGADVPAPTLLQAHFFLWMATGERDSLEQSFRLMTTICDLAPEDRRAAMVANDRVWRSIAEEAAAHGLV